MSRTWRLAWDNLQARRRSVVAGALGVAVGSGCLLFFGALGSGLSEAVRTRLFPIDRTLLEVRASPVALGSFLGGGGALDDGMVDRLRRLDGVQDAYPRLELRAPSSFRLEDADFLGTGRPLRMYAEVMADGVDPRLVTPELARGQRFDDPGPGQPIPVVASGRLLELYNKSFAPARGLPTLSPAMLEGFTLPVAWGQSFVAGNHPQAEIGSIRLAGLSRHAIGVGVTLPLAAVQRLNRTYGRPVEGYTSVLLRLDGAQRPALLAPRLEAMGLTIDDDERRLAEQTGHAVDALTGTLLLLAMLVSLLGAFNIAQAFAAQTRERRREIGLLRAVGASRREVLRLLLSEATLIGAAGGVAGAVGGWLAGLVADGVAQRWLPAFPFKPESFFRFAPGWWLAAIAIGVLGAVLGALGPARAAARVDPARALGD